MTKINKKHILYSLTLTLFSLGFVPAASAQEKVSKKQDTADTLREETILIKAGNDAGGEIKVTVNKNGNIETRVFKVDEDTPMEEVHKILIQEMKLNPNPQTFPFLDGQEIDNNRYVIPQDKISPFSSKKELLPFLGVAASETPDEISKYLPIPRSSGITVRSIAERSPASKTTLTVDDLIFQIDDQIIFNPDQFASLIRSYEKDQSVKIHYLRKGEKLTTEAKLELKELPVAIKTAPSNPKFWIQEGVVPPPLIHVPGKENFTRIYPDSVIQEDRIIQLNENPIRVRSVIKSDNNLDIEIETQQSVPVQKFNLQQNEDETVSPDSIFLNDQTTESSNATEDSEDDSLELEI